MQMEKKKGTRKRKKNMTFAEKCDAMLERTLDGTERLEALGELSDKLSGVIGAALDDERQFCRHIVVDKGRDENGDTVSENVEKVFEKVDFRSVKEAAGAIKAVADSLRCVFAIPDFDSLSRAAKSGEADSDPFGVTVSFENGEDYAL